MLEGKQLYYNSQSLDHIEKEFNNDPFQFGIIKGGKQLSVGVGRIIPHRNVLKSVLVNNQKIKNNNKKVKH